MHLVLFFTFGLSLKRWEECGILEREAALYKQLAARGITVSFLTFGDQSDYDYQEQLSPIKIVPVYAFLKRPSYGFLRFFQSLTIPFRLRKFFQEAVVLKTNQMWGAWIAVIAKIFYRKKLILRSGYEQFRFAILMKMSFPLQVFIYVNSFIAYWLSNRITISSESAKTQINRYFYIPPEKIAVVPNYVETERFISAEVSGKINRLLFVGRLEEQKNLFNLLDAVKQTPYEIDLIGDGTLKSDLITYARKNNIKAHFFKRVAHQELPEIYNRYPVYILPSFYEGMPKTLIEAMSCGRAVIGTNVEGIKEFITDRVTGLLCETNPGPLALAIEHLMGDPALQKKLGEAARRYIVDNFSLDKIVKDELEIINCTVGGKI